MNKTFLILFRNAFFSYKDKIILENLNFSILNGEIISLIGKNGVGKTSLLHLILGINKLNSGSFLNNSKSISYVPQKLNFDKNIPLTVKDFLFINHKKSLEKDNDIFNIYDLLNKKMGELSGGELQKVFITNALIKNPELLILDEPISAFDISSQESFFKIILDLKEKMPSLSIIIVSHNIDFVFRHSDKILCLHGDGKYCFGNVKEVSNDINFLNNFGKYLAPYSHNHP